MTRKHFILLANSLGADMVASWVLTLEISEEDVETRYWATLDTLATTNPSFDRERFVAAATHAANMARVRLYNLTETIA